MRFLTLFILVLFLFSCGSKEVKNDKKKIPEDTTGVQKIPGPDKSYLKKRPEEFQEFFMLTDIIPFTGKTATKKDVKSKKAVFNLNGKKDPTHAALKIRLPFFAFLLQPDNKPSKYVAVMQAETLRGDTILGYKEANGLYGICKPSELEYFEVQRDNVYKTLQ